MTRADLTFQNFEPAERATHQLAGSRIRTRRNRTRLFAALTLAALGLGASPVGAANAAEPICQNVSFGNYRLLNPGSPRTPTVAVSLPAGSISIPNASSWDAYPERTEMYQSSERWAVEFIGASGQVVGTSSATGDLADNVAEAHWQGSLGSVTLSAPAVSVRAVHRPDAASINSVAASDITLCYVPIPATTVPATTSPPETTSLTTTVITTVPAPTVLTTTVLSTTPPPSGPTTVASSTTTAGVATTVPRATTAVPVTTAPGTESTTGTDPATGASTTSTPSVTSGPVVSGATTTPGSTAPPPSGPTISEPAETAAGPDDGEAATESGGLAITGVELMALVSLGLMLLGGGMFLLLTRRAARIATGP